MNKVNINCNILETTVLDSFNELMELDGVVSGELLPNASYGGGFVNGCVIKGRWFDSISTEMAYYFKLSISKDIVMLNREIIFNMLKDVECKLVEICVDKEGFIWGIVTGYDCDDSVDEVIDILRSFEKCSIMYYTREKTSGMHGDNAHVNAIKMFPGSESLILGDISRGNYIVESKVDYPIWIPSCAGKILGGRKGDTGLDDQAFERTLGKVLSYTDEKAKGSNQYVYKNVRNVIRQMKDIRIANYLKPVINVKVG